VALFLVLCTAVLPGGHARQATSVSASGTENANDPTWLLPYLYPTTRALELSRDPAARYVFAGTGYGHGVGMSQWGARGRALEGQDARTILTSYYTGAVTGTVPAGADRMLVRLLHDAMPGQGDRVHVVAGSVSLAGVAETLTSGGYLVFRPGADGYHITAISAAGVHLADMPVTGGLHLTGSIDSLLRVEFKPASAVTGTPGATYNVYRGSLAILPSPQGLDVINDIPLEQYLYSVVPSEMPAAWPVEALRAQAIASRTYAIHEQRGPAATWDLDDTTASQVYLGALREQITTTQAVQSTAGLVLLSDEKPIRAYYHACDAGYTEDGDAVFPDLAATYLRGFHDVNSGGAAYDRDCPRNTWKVAGVSTSDIEQALGTETRSRIGAIRWIDFSSRSASGRIVQVVVGGSLGIDALPGQTFRRLFNQNHSRTAEQLLSTGFELTRESP